MKIDITCKDKAGHKMIVLADLDYIDVNNYQDLKNWCCTELSDINYDFDINDFDIVNYDDIAKEHANNEHESYTCDPFNNHIA